MKKARTCIAAISAAWLLATLAWGQPLRLPDQPAQDRSMFGLGAVPTPKVDAVTIKLHLINGSAGGPVLAKQKVTLELTAEDRPAQKYEAESDAVGVVTVEKVAVPVPLQPVFTTEHAGLVQEAELPPIDGTRAVYEQDVRVFETTTERPAWTVAMRHVIVERDPESGKLQVMEILVLQNPSDRVWLGAEHDPRGPVTFEMLVPSASAGIKPMAGLTEDRMKFDRGQLASTGPMFPDTTRYQFWYTLASRKGQATLTLVAPAATENLMVLLPPDVRVQAEGLQTQGVQDMMGTKVQSFAAHGLQAGQSATVVISGVAERDSSGLSQTGWLVLGGGAVMLLVTAGVMMLRRPKAVTTTR